MKIDWNKFYLNSGNEDSMKALQVLIIISQRSLPELVLSISALWSRLVARRQCSAQLISQQGNSAWVLSPLCSVLPEPYSTLPEVYSEPIALIFGVTPFASTNEL